MSPDLGRFAVLGADAMDKVELKLLARLVRRGSW